MKKTSIFCAAFAILLVALFSGCQSKSMEEIIEKVEVTSERTFTSDAKTAINTTTEYFSLYAPAKMNVEEATANNLVLTDGKQSYFIFYNNLEPPTSELNYEQAKQSGTDALFIKTFKDAEKFGYVQVLANQKKAYELQVGVGGVKVTTYVERNKIVGHIEEMMKIARSIIENNEN